MKFTEHDTNEVAETLEELFQFFDTENEGDSVIIAEDGNGEPVGFIQFDGEEIFFVEALNEGQGIGTALVNELKSRHDTLQARSVQKHARGFWAKVGFAFSHPDGFGDDNWVWEG